MRKHVEHLFGGYLGGFQDGLVELAWNNPDERAVRHAQLYKTDALDTLVEHAVKLNSKAGCNVYIGAALRRPGTAPFARAKDADFLCLTAGYVDLDEPGTVLAAKGIYKTIVPTAVVITGTIPHPRAQLWWKLEEPLADPEVAQAMLKSMAHNLNGDPTVTNPARVMRLAGSIAWPVKPGREMEGTDLINPASATADYPGGAVSKAFPAPSMGSIDRSPPPWEEDAQNGPGIKREPDVFGLDTGQVVDGREAYMLATLTACLVQLIGEKGGAVPDAGELYDLAWPQFCKGADITKPRANGQPWTANAFWAKAAYTLQRFAAGDIAGCRSKEEALASYAAKQLADQSTPIGGPAIVGFTGPAARQPTPIAVHAAFPIDAATIPPRKWSVPGLLLCGSVSILVAPPGSGKSLLTLQMAIAVAAGVSWGGWQPRGRQKVLVINSEDDLDEMRRRLFVAAREMGVAQSQLEGWLDLAANPEGIVIAKADSRTKTVVKTPLSEDLILTIQTNHYGLVVVDPFAETFVGDENSNSEVKWAGVLWRAVARATGIALWLVHHTKKYAAGMAGDADASRGGGAMVGIARVVGTLFTMTEDEAEGMEVDPERRGDYVRYDDGKANYSRKGDVRWFEKASRDVGNATGFLPSDEMGVLLAWKPPDGMEGITVNDLNDALDVIDRGVTDGAGQSTGQWFAPRASGADSKRWVGHSLELSLGCSNKTARKLVGMWLKTKVLEVFEFIDPKQRKPRKGVRSIRSNRPGSVTSE